MGRMRVFLLCFLLINLGAQSTYGWACAPCQIEVVERPTCHQADATDQPPGLLQQECCCPASGCIAAPEQTPLLTFVAPDEASKQTAGKCSGVRLANASAPHRPANVLPGGPDRAGSPPLFLLYRSYLI